MEILTSDYTYNLPEDRIAMFPTKQREQSKLLFYNRGEIAHHQFVELPQLLPEHALLVFNNSKVIPARLRLKNQTGAIIEVLLLQPADKTISAHGMMQMKSPVRWACTIGNKKRWKSGQILREKRQEIELTVHLVNPESNIVEFAFTGCSTWAEVLQAIGDTPLPPYIKRQSQLIDNQRYQTVYSSVQGAVAAPTAGLHFTPELMQTIESHGFRTEYLTLHVSAGTFMPIKSADATAHNMHEEAIFFTKENVENLMNHQHKTIAVGTTSCRLLESLYWFGVKLFEEGNASFSVDRHFAYNHRANLLSRAESLASVLIYMKKNGLTHLHGHTSIYIYPGYTFRMVDGLITNFHQPNSTLLLLISALIGPDWRMVYNSALASEYRFLSYGDSSLLLPRA